MIVSMWRVNVDKTGIESGKEWEREYRDRERQGLKESKSERENTVIERLGVRERDYRNREWQGERERGWAEHIVIVYMYCSLNSNQWVLWCRVEFLFFFRNNNFVVPSQYSKICLAYFHYFYLSLENLTITFDNQA